MSSRLRVPDSLIKYSRSSVVSRALFRPLAPEFVVNSLDARAAVATGGPLRRCYHFNVPFHVVKTRSCQAFTGGIHRVQPHVGPNSDEG